MLYPDLIVRSKINYDSKYLLPDDISAIKFKNFKNYKSFKTFKSHFENYPLNIHYSFNSRGYRDLEWPTSLNELKEAIWCVGDSCAVGLGLPAEYSWPSILSQILNRRTINVSMCAAPNNWMYRKSKSIIEQIAPKTLTVHWGFVERDEVSDLEALRIVWDKFYKNIKLKTWPKCSYDEVHTLPKHIYNECFNLQMFDYYSRYLDEDRIINTSKSTTEEDIQRTLDYIIELETYDTNIIHTFTFDVVADKYKDWFNEKITTITKKSYPIHKRIDYARDLFHYGPITSKNLAESIANLI